MARENTKQQILEAALELFSEKGFEASSMSEIADTVGIKKLLYIVIITPSIMKMQQAFSSYDSVSTTMEICSTVFIE